MQLDTTLYLPAHTPAPAVLLAHGFGGTKDSVASQARALARHGYLVLAYTSRGFGRSGGLIHLDAPNYEVHDASLLVSYLAGLPEVRRRDGRPDIAVAGSSYGGALALLLAGTDPRVQAVAADITWNDLGTALFPNAAGDLPGVFAKLWAAELFQAALPSPTAPGSGATSCGRFAAELCADYQRTAETGQPTPGLLALLRASSPATVLSRITAPTLLSQGEDDSLFPLSQADANARGIAAHGTPVKVIWRAGGHDGFAAGTGIVTSAMISWFDDVFGAGVPAAEPFTVEETGSAISAETGNPVNQVLHAPGYPGLGAPVPPPVTVPVGGPAQPIVAPPGGIPAAITSVPGVGGLLGQAVQLAGAGGVGANGGPDGGSGSASAGDGLSGAAGELPGQTALFESTPLVGRLLIAGVPTVRLRLTPSSTDATLFVSLHDVAPDGTDVLPAALVAPLRLSGLIAGRPSEITVRLPAIVHSVAAGHRLRLVVSTTDLAYQLPVDARSYLIAVPGGASPVTLPTLRGSVATAGDPVAWLITGGVVCLLLAAGVAGLLRHRRRRLRADPRLAEVPVAVTRLVKEFGDGYRAVDAVSFRVERGQVVGLLGPNGAGKTTTLRALVGLVVPTQGVIHIFGQPVTPGAAVLARVGAFIEGPGFLPHLSGRDNLRLYWAATGRPPDEAELTTALEIAGLGASMQRRVRTYSHGMRQRLGIAQAMLGLPEVLVLDEPTNGLDPPQIAEMREVLRAYAATGRTVLVSSHLLAEVEQTCTHVVVMHRGRVVAAGSVAEIAGGDGSALAVDDPARAGAVLAAAGIASRPVPVRRALEDVFLGLVGADQSGDGPAGVDQASDAEQRGSSGEH